MALGPAAVGLETYMPSAREAWLAESPSGMLQPLLIVDWVLTWGCTLEKDRVSCNKLEIESNLS